MLFPIVHGAVQVPIGGARLASNARTFFCVRAAIRIIRIQANFGIRDPEILDRETYGLRFRSENS